MLDHAKGPRELDDEGYISVSSLDSPPVISEDTKKDEASEDFKNPRPSDIYVGERLFDVDFSITLKPVEGKAIKIPLMADRIRGTLVEELMSLTLSDARNVRIIQAVLDNPKDRVRSGEQPTEVPEKQKELF